MNKKTILIIIGFIFSIFIFSLIIRNHVITLFFSEDVTVDVSNEISIVPCSKLSSQNIVPKINILGRVNSTNRINIISEVNGISEFNDSKFEVGEFFNQGDAILSINNSDLDLELKSRKSQFLTLLIQILPEIKMDFPSMARKFQAYVNNFNLNQKINTLPGLSGSRQIRNYLSSKQILANYYSIKSLEKKLDKFQIKAPFDGILTNTLIDEGSNVIIGQPLGEFINLNNYELVTSVSVNESRLISLNDSVLIHSDDIQSKITGVVSRIGSHINPLTQSIDLYVNIVNGDVKDGMFVSGEILCDTLQNISVIARSQIIDNQEIYISKNDTLKRKNIKIILTQNDSVIVSGIDKEDCVVKQNRKYYYDDMPINNAEAKSLPKGASKPLNFKIETPSKKVDSIIIQTNQGLSK